MVQCLRSELGTHQWHHNTVCCLPKPASYGAKLKSCIRAVMCELPLYFHHPIMLICFLEVFHTSQQLVPF